MENVIELKNINKTFENFKMENLSLTIKKGFVTGLIGENGAGKSTLIKIIMNLVRPNKGEVRVFGLDYKNHEKEIKEKIGFIYNNPLLYEDLTLTDIERIVGHSYRNWDKNLFQYYSSKFELPLKKKVEGFSDGMKIKASLAFALSHHADLLIFDEPTANLDPVFRREFIEILREIITDEEKSILLSTHILDDLTSLADYIVYIQKGEIVFAKDIHEIDEQYWTVRGSLELLDEDTKQLFIKINKTNTGFEALTDEVDRVEEWFGEHVIIEKASLDDIMYFSRGVEKSEAINHKKYSYS